jgi:deazaflavin-dependent oxidoreductase (nitroreductase family)
VGIGNVVVCGVLRSPLHSLLSRSTAVIRYVGRQSGRQFMTPVQYVEGGADVLILVGRPETKTWWRNFRTDRDIDVLVRRTWRPMTARAVVGADEPATITPLLDAYVKRFPKTAARLGPSNETRARGAVIVWCRPR